MENETNLQKYHALYNLKEYWEEFINKNSGVINNAEKTIGILEEYKCKISKLKWSESNQYSRDCMIWFINLNGQKSSGSRDEYELPNLGLADFNNHDTKKKYASIFGSFYYFIHFGIAPTNEDIEELNNLIKTYIDAINKRIDFYKRIIETAQIQTDDCIEALSKLNNIINIYSNDDYSSSIDRANVSSLIRYIHYASNMHDIDVDKKLEIIRELNILMLEALQYDDTIKKESTEPFKADSKPKDKSDFEKLHDEDFSLIEEHVLKFKEKQNWAALHRSFIDTLDVQYGNLEYLLEYSFSNVNRLLINHELVTGSEGEEQEITEYLDSINQFLSSYGAAKPFNIEEYFEYVYLKNIYDTYQDYLNDDNPINYKRHFNKAIKWVNIYDNLVEAIAINNNRGVTEDVNNVIFLALNNDLNDQNVDNHFLGIDFINSDNSHDLYSTDYHDLHKGIRKLRTIPVESISRGKGCVKNATIYDRQRGLYVDESSFHKHRENDMRIVYLNISHFIDKKYYDQYFKDMKPCYIIVMFGKKTTNGNNLYDTMTVDKRGGSNFVQKVLLDFYDFINQKIEEIVSKTQNEAKRKKLIEEFIMDYIQRNNSAFLRELPAAKNYGSYTKKIQKQNKDGSLIDGDILEIGGESRHE